MVTNAEAAFDALGDPHIGQPVSNATEVEVRFVTVGDDTTRVEIEQRGWETYGGEAGTWRARNRIGWDALVPHFTQAIEERRSR